MAETTSPSRAKRSNDSRTARTLSEKVQTVTAYENWKGPKRFFFETCSIPRTTVLTWKAQADVIKALAKTHQGDLKRVRQTKRAELEELLLAWFRDIRHRFPYTPISRSLLFSY